VITIIGILVGLLMPAILRAREAARITQCTNNQHNLSGAIHQYEMSKQPSHYPGYLNQVQVVNPANQTTYVYAVGWVPVLFPFLGRNDLWEGINGWRNPTFFSTPPATPSLPEVVCPDDPNATGGTGVLTYVVDLGLYIDPTNNPTNTPFGSPNPPYPEYHPISTLGIFRNYSGGVGTPDPSVSSSDVKSPSRTVMLSERPDNNTTGARFWSNSWNATGIPISPNNNIQTSPSPWNQAPAASFGFVWPDPTFDPNNIAVHGTQAQYNLRATVLIATPTAPYKNPPLQSLHPGIVVVTFCDGHAESVANDTPCIANLATNPNAVIFQGAP
jgi:type II secretory pathway pseudopilin PulG